MPGKDARGGGCLKPGKGREKGAKVQEREVQVDMGTETKQGKGEGQVRGWGVTQW